MKHHINNDEVIGITPLAPPVPHESATLTQNEDAVEAILELTNTNTIIANAGPVGSCHPHTTASNVSKITQYLDLYLLNGLNQSPQDKMKFNGQVQKSAQVNHMYKLLFGTCLKRQHKELEAFCML